MVNKSKKHEVKFVEMLALDVIKKLIDMFSSDDGWINLFRTVHKFSDKEIQNKKSYFCHFCNNGFCNLKNLKVHIEKFHHVAIGFTCEVCDFQSNLETDFERHVKEKHIDKQNLDNLMEVDSENVFGNKDGLKRERTESDFSSPSSSPTTKKVSVVVPNLQEQFCNLQEQVIP